MTRIKVVPPEEAEGRLKEIYDSILNKRGKLAEVHKVQSLRPESIVAHMDLYMETMFSRSELSRAEREMMAVIVSENNDCEYCRLHHAEALNHYWKNEDKISLLVRDFKNAGLSEREIFLCEFARELTLNPGVFCEDTMIEKLKKAGFSDNAILDATLVVAYFNFVNRLVLGLGVEFDESEKKGYNY